jgi:septation ring formation regulator EzrA
MADEIENLMLEHLKRFQAGQDRIERKLDDLTRRVGNLESGQANIIQHLGTLAAADAQQQLTADGFNQRLERIERRLELS